MCPGPLRGPSWLRRCPQGPVRIGPAGTSLCISQQTPGPRAGGSAPRCPCREQHEQRQVSSRGSASRRRPPWGCRPCGGAVGPSLAGRTRRRPGPGLSAAAAAAASTGGGNGSGCASVRRLDVRAGCRHAGVPARPPSWLTDLSACPQEVGAAWGLLLWGHQAPGGAPPAASADPHRLPTPAQWGLGLDLGTWGTQTFGPQGAGE